MRKFVCVFVVALLFGASFHPSLAMGQFFIPENELIGEKAPDFTLKTLNSDSVNLTTFRDGKRAIIFFWATWCPHCRRELTGMMKDMDEFTKKNIKLVLVDVGEDKGTVQKYLKQNKITLDVFLDEENTLAEPYGLIGVPTFYFVNEDGIVKDVQHALPENYEEILAKS